MRCGQPVGRAAGAFALTNSSVRTSDLSHLLISDHRELSKVRVGCWVVVWWWYGAKH